ncbi:MAG: isoprenylcysteine carboxylmethyltransferase family protein [Pseudomonadota bacterium]
MKGFPDLPPLWWLGSIVVIYAVKWSLPGWHFASGLLTTLSWILCVAGLAVIFWAASWFLRKKTPIEPHHVPKTLIVEGPYHLSRNPIYLGLVLLTLATAVGQGSLVGLVVTAALWWVLDHRFAAVEEAQLAETFGPEAAAYLKATRRWI